jgi:hypothetical protein
MGNQIIQQPDGRLCVWSSAVDELVIVDATREELLDHFANAAAEDARSRAARAIDAVLVGHARGVYRHRTMTHAEAVERAARK